MNLNLKPKTRVVFDPLEMSAVNRRLLLAIGRGLSNKAIAFELAKTENTVKAQVWVLSQKTGMDRLRMALLGARMLEAMAS